jgi:UDPglucose 6-dehydrogenase
MTDPVLSIVGLGKIGSPLLACLAACGYRVVGIDVDPRPLDLIRSGRAPVPEPGVADLLRTHRDRISVTQDCGAAVAASGLTFIAVPTPTDGDGTYSLAHVRAVCAQIGRALRGKPDFHVVVVTSTLLPEDMDTGILPTLEHESTKRAGRDFGLCYSPEFVALGRVVDGLQHPDLVLIGESDERSGSLLEGVSRRLAGDRVPVVRTNFVNAELAKIAINTFVTTKISYANMLAEVCERIPGCDVDATTAAIGLDSRIGPRYLKGGLGFGGPCFPRDNVAFSAMARRRGIPATLADATDAVNRRQVRRILEQIRPRLRPGGAAGVLGLTYTVQTDVVEESQGLELARAMAGEGFLVTVYDPLGMPNAERILNRAVRYARSAEECIQHAELVVIATPWDEFKRLRPQQFAHNPPRARARVVFDCWRILSAEEMRPVTDYVTIGTYAAPPAVTNLKL